MIAIELIQVLGFMISCVCLTLEITRYLDKDKNDETSKHKKK